MGRARYFYIGGIYHLARQVSEFKNTKYTKGKRRKTIKHSSFVYFVPFVVKSGATLTA